MYMHMCRVGHNRIYMVLANPTYVCVSVGVYECENNHDGSQGR